MEPVPIRHDLAAYKPKPVFGLTWRQIATVAVVAAVSVAAFAGTTALGLPRSLRAPAVTSLAAVVGFLGMGSVDGLPPEEWLGLWWEGRKWPKTITPSPVTISPGGARPARGTARERRRGAPTESEVDFLAIESERT